MNSRTYFSTSVAACHPSLSKIEMDPFRVPFACQSSCPMVVCVWMRSLQLFCALVLPLAQHPMRPKINSRRRFEGNGKQFCCKRESHMRAHVRYHCRCYYLRTLQCQQRTKLVDCRAPFPVRVLVELHHIDLSCLSLKWETVVTHDVRRHENISDFSTTHSNHLCPCFAWKANLPASFRRIRFSGQTP
jgi:hypothetical protein